MTAREIRAGDAEPFAALRAELDLPEAFGAAALAEAAAARPVLADPIDVPFVTIDPPGSRDLDQALHIERRGSGFRVRYAIADLAAFVTPGGALDAEVWERGVTYYAPDGAVPLHPPALSAGAASLLPGQATPSVLFTLDLDSEGALEATDVRRATVRSTAQLTYADEPPELLATVGELRIERERARGGVSLPLPEQEVVRTADGWDVEYRAPLATEAWNAQISLLTGMAAADLMLANGAGVLRTLPAADPRSLRRLERTARALGVAWVEPYPDFVRSLDPAVPAHAAVLHEATGVMRGAGYTVFGAAAPAAGAGGRGDGAAGAAAPAETRHAALAEEYAHVTAPLRRLADRYALECTLAAAAGEPPPDWVRERLAALPAAMQAAGRRAGALERAAVDLVEALRLQHRVGERFTAVVVDDGLVHLRDPAVRARCDGDPPVGETVEVVLAEADPASRTVRFAPA